MSLFSINNLLFFVRELSIELSGSSEDEVSELHPELIGDNKNLQGMVVCIIPTTLGISLIIILT
jgi:hypothetical protein